MLVEHFSRGKVCFLWYGGVDPWTATPRLMLRGHRQEGVRDTRVLTDSTLSAPPLGDQRGAVETVFSRRSTETCTARDLSLRLRIITQEA